MEESIKKILVTGSSETIGTGLCEMLLADGYDVVGLDRKPNKWRKQVDEITVRGDLLDPTTFQKIPNDIDLVIHLAANARVYNLVEDPKLARDNFETTFNILNFAREQRITRFLFASSREVYGNVGDGTYSEDEVSLKNCESPYTASKIAGEALTQSFQQCYGIDFVIFRFSNVYGMYDDSDRLIPTFLQSAQRNKDLIVFGKEKVLDFTYITDCVSGIENAIKQFETAKNETYNIASGRGNSIEKVAQLICEYTKSESKIVMQESRMGEVIKFIADISKANKAFGYEPKVEIEEGLKKAIQWYKNSM